MPRIFRHQSERSWLQIRRSQTDTTSIPSRFYPPQQVKDRWEGNEATQVLYELKTGDFVRAEFSTAGEFVDGYGIARKGGRAAVQSFFEEHDLVLPWHLAEK